jgi:hypothetical protein
LGTTERLRRGSRRRVRLHNQAQSPKADARTNQVQKRTRGREFPGALWSMLGFFDRSYRVGDNSDPFAEVAVPESRLASTAAAAARQVHRAPHFQRQLAWCDAGNCRSKCDLLRLPARVLLEERRVELQGSQGSQGSQGVARTVAHVVSRNAAPLLEAGRDCRDSRDPNPVPGESPGTWIICGDPNVVRTPPFLSAPRIVEITTLL